MILVCGIPTEQPVVLVCKALNSLGYPYVIFNQRAFTQNDISINYEGSLITGHLIIEGRKFPLNAFTGIFLRLMDYRQLPEYIGPQVSRETKVKCINIHEKLLDWFENTDVKIMNKPSSMGSNGSKPYQAQLIQQAGIRIPETLITNNPQTAMKFINSYEKVIYKSISGVRSIVKAVNKKDMARLEQISSCPIQFQKFIKGIDVRVHIAGKDIHATAINSTRTDYRYPDDKNDSTPEMSIYKLDERTHKKCILLAQNLGLSLSGIDLKITTEGQAYCLEINPCPGFSHYELKTRQPIAKSIAKFLC